LRVVVENRLDEDTTVHWHGVRTPNAMDGVPFLTQKPIAARGGTFVYEFDLPDAGTYWYHPHLRSHEQVDRGLSGALIVEEADPIKVDRDIVWLLDDWRLDRDAAVRGDFDSFMDASHAGRIGNTVTVNGRVREDRGSRASGAPRPSTPNGALRPGIPGHRPWVVALDGQAVEPHRPEGDVVVLGPAGRADLVIDMTAEPGSRHEVRDGFYARFAYRLIDFVYSGQALRARPPAGPIALPANRLPEPDLRSAERHEVVFSGGMMEHVGMMGGMRGGMGGMMGEWGGLGDQQVSATDHVHDPMLVLRRGSSHVLRMVNDTAWHHPIHLHGHVFRVVSRNGKSTQRREWLDTVLVEPKETTEIAFVADNPGDWMFHCHILEHQASGMMAVVRVA
jgi:FtsP/CotA-like multicopper oxidase with cupredoxin domain